ncbi:PAS domain-containing sensor histidine kinase [Aquabacterium sp.]|uniref:PAS domain-containing sensor histidine kinase n=1 Tax=Aquabacterium sp. TaxID=1872578 RepID=UPI002BA87001|nr:ATP-binding protein [Aquabacterium sp.]HSW04265.1 ATP-binding protein [Aquabacterium sp.]
MSLSFNTVPSSRPAPQDEPSTMPMPSEPVGWRRWADAMPDICLWLAPNSGRIVDCNRALFSTLGYGRSEVFGWPLQALAEPHNLETAGATWRKLASCGELRDADCTLRARNGFDVAVSATASPVLNDHGKLVAGLVVMRDITERRRREQTLQVRKRQLKTLAYELTVAESRERARVAQDLQDGIGPLLAQARATLQRLAQGPQTLSVDSLRELETLLVEGQRSADAASFALASPLLQAAGLQAAIDDLAQRLTSAGPLIVRVEGMLPATLQMPEASGAVMFRVLRELTTNAIRHARANQLWIRVQLEPDRLCIVVGDDGVGFDVARLPTSFSAASGCGLFSADAQMQAIGGRLVVQSKAGRGTRAMLVLPMAPTAGQPGGPAPA